MEDLRKKLFEFFIAADKYGALDFIDQWAKSNSYEKALTEILEPALQKLGEMWANQQDVNLAQGYISAKISEEIMKKLMKERETTGEKKSNAGIAVIGNIEDDYHALGRKMVGNFLELSGWTVYDLGNDVSAADFVDKALEVNASIIGASAMMYSNAQNMHKLRDEMEKRNLRDKIKFVVGGAIFNFRPKLVDEIKADGTAPNALKAVELFNRLTKK